MKKLIEFVIYSTDDKNDTDKKTSPETFQEPLNKSSPV